MSGVLWLGVCGRGVGVVGERHTQQTEIQGQISWAKGDSRVDVSLCLGGCGRVGEVVGDRRGGRQTVTTDHTLTRGQTAYTRPAQLYSLPTQVERFNTLRYSPPRTIHPYWALLFRAVSRPASRQILRIFLRLVWPCADWTAQPTGRKQARCWSREEELRHRQPVASPWYVEGSDGSR